MTSLRVVCGRFHPELEDALFQELAALRADDPLGPLAVVSPSRWLSERLQERAAREFPRGLAGVHFVTLFGLARRTAPPDKRWVGDPLFLARLVLDCAERAPDVAEAFRDFARRAPAVGEAVRRALEDLRDAALDPDVLDAAIAELDPVVFTPRDAARLRDVAALHRAYAEAIERMGIADRADIFRQAALRVPDSRFLASRRRVLVYGLYDATQAQWDFLEALARSRPCTLLAPIPVGERARVHPAFRYAEPFFRSYLLALAERSGARIERLPPAAARRASGGVEDLLFSEDEAERAAAASVRFLTATGERDEAWTVAREVVRLVVDEGRCAFRDVGVVARSLEGCAEAFREAFAEHGIPCRLSAGAPAASHPLVKTVALLSRLRRTGFDRRSVMELASSPFFRAGADGEERARWDRATRVCRISRGPALWEERLARAERWAAGERDPGIEGAWTPDPGAPPEALRRLRDLVADLARALDQVPATASWSDMAAAHERLLDRWIDAGEAERALADDIRGALRAFREFDALGRPVSRDAFEDLWRRRLEALEGAPEDAPRGVTILDAEAARGLSFPVLFLVGLNDQVFPRVVTPEPFLSDNARRAITQTLGYKIAQGRRLPEKIAGYDEERLLFCVALNAAERELVLVRQRADDRGRLRAPSIYWDMVRERLKDPAPPFQVPRGLTLRLARDDYRAGLTRLEAAAFRPAPDRRPPDDRAPALTPYDGALGPSDALWNRLTRRGIAPTHVETFAECPFRFFAGKVLRLEEEDEPADVDDLSAREEGQIYDRILTLLYKRLKDEGGFGDVGRALGLLGETAEGVFAEHERTGFVLPPALWAATRGKMRSALEAFVRFDLENLSGAVPENFQKELKGTIASASGAVPFHGFADRLDRCPSAARRVVDYKRSYNSAKHGGTFATCVKTLKCVQPGVYAALSGAASVVFYFLRSFRLYAYGEDKAVRRLFFQELVVNGDVMSTFKDRLGRALELMREGAFFIRPDDGAFGHCGTCSFGEICRKSHRPTRRRSESCPQAEALEALRAAREEQGEAE